MPFSTTGSIVSTDLDNMLRGLYRDNSDHALTGTAVETNLSSTSIGASTIGPSGGLFILAVGTASGAGGTKTVRMYLGASSFFSLSVPANNQCWFIKAWIYNTATNAQRIYVEAGSIPAAAGTAAVPVLSYEYLTAAVDTTQTQTLKTTGTLASAADTVTDTMLDVYIAQIT